MELKPLEKRLYLASPTMHGSELEYMRMAYETNWMSTVGENINAIEASFAHLVGVGRAVALSSGTAALHLAVRLAGERLYGRPEAGHGSLEGRKVFATDMTFAATVNPIAYEGGEAVFIDSEYDTWNMDPEALERAFSMYPEVRLVVAAHLYGTPARIDEIKEICVRHGALLIEDAAESLGAYGKADGLLRRLRDHLVQRQQDNNGLVRRYAPYRRRGGSGKGEKVVAAEPRVSRVVSA